MCCASKLASRGNGCQYPESIGTQALQKANMQMQVIYSVKIPQVDWLVTALLTHSAR